jgi:hypothetical protein
MDLRRLLIACSCRSQTEINTAIICGSAPSIQPLFKRILNRIIGFRRSRSPYYYYGGQTALTGLHPVEIDRDLRRDSISALELPTRAYCPLKDDRDGDGQDGIMRVRPAEEEEIRARIRAFSSPMSTFLLPASIALVPTRPESTMPTSGSMKVG